MPNGIWTRPWRSTIFRANRSHYGYSRLGGTWTHTPLREQPPQGCASTSSATNRKYIAKEGLEPSRPFTLANNRGLLYHLHTSQVGEMGLEPIRPTGLGILSPLRLPIPPLTVKTKKQLFRVAWDLKTVFIFYFQLFFPSSPFKCFAKRAEPNDTPLPHKPESFINEKDFAVIFTLFVKFI